MASLPVDKSSSSKSPEHHPSTDAPREQIVEGTSSDFGSSYQPDTKPRPECVTYSSDNMPCSTGTAQSLPEAPYIDLHRMGPGFYDADGCASSDDSAETLYSVGDLKAPKVHQSAYAFFVQSAIEEQKKNPDKSEIDAVEFSRKCSDTWQAMSEEEKQKFYELERNDKERYYSERRNFLQRRDEKFELKKQAPKKPLSAFFWFTRDIRAEVRAALPNAYEGDVATEMGRRWSTAEPEVKQKYEAIAAEDKARYEREMKEYETKRAGNKRDSNNRIKPKTPVKTRPRNRRTAFSYFVTSVREVEKISRPAQEISYTAFLKKLSDAWEMMSDREKGTFYELERKDKERYDSEMQDFERSQNEKLEAERESPKKDPSRRWEVAEPEVKRAAEDKV